MGRIYNPQKNSAGFVFDQTRAEHAVKFIEHYCSHVKGPQGGRPLRLEKWQIRFIQTLFGWVDKQSKQRRYRECYLTMSRKNGKSLLCSALGLYMLYCEPEQGREIYCAASDREQARLIFSMCKSQVLAQGRLKKLVEPLRYEIRYTAHDSFLKCISSETTGAHGLNPSGLLIDELHCIADRDFVDALVTGQGARREPLCLYITTAGFDRNSICYEKYKTAVGVRDGIIDDPRYLPMIFESDPADDWTSPEVWKKSNPNMNVSISEDYLKRECRKAKQTPAYEQTFRRLHCNQWTESSSRWLSTDAWAACQGSYTEQDLAGQVCFAGLDLASTQDLSCLCYVFAPNPAGRYRTLLRAWLPEEAYKKALQRGLPYQVWRANGVLQVTSGAVQDYQFIRAQILKDAKSFRIKQLGYDPWGATQLATELQADGLNLIQMRQGMKTMSPATKEAEQKILSKQIEHDDNPLLTWCLSNATCRYDAQSNYMLDRSKATEKIDAAVAFIMALELTCQNAQRPSVYDTRGLLFV